MAAAPAPGRTGRARQHTPPAAPRAGVSRDSALLAQVSPGGRPRSDQGQESSCVERRQSTSVLGVELGPAGAGVGRAPPGGTLRKVVWRPDHFAQSAPGPPACMGSGADGLTSGACTEVRGTTCEVVRRASAGSHTSGTCARVGWGSAFTSGDCLCAARSEATPWASQLGASAWSTRSSFACSSAGNRERSAFTSLLHSASKAHCVH
jgi:hypothetical protein